MFKTPVNKHDFKTYQNYLALRNHFRGDGFDYFQYHGKTNATPKSYLKRNDKVWFARWSIAHRQDHGFGFFLSQFAYTDSNIPIEMTGPNSKEIYTKWQSNTLSIDQTYSNDLSKLCLRENLREYLFDCKDNNQFLLDCLDGQYSVEFVSIFLYLLDYDKRDGVLGSFPDVFSNYIKRCHKYLPFLSFDLYKLADDTEKKMKDFLDM